MNIRFFATYCLLVLAGLSACSDEETFTSSPSHLLSFSNDTIRFDTVFSNVPSSNCSFWVYNRSGKGIRCSGVRLQRGNQTGFRANVDGVYLGKAVGYQTSEIEIRNHDSIRVYVELTAPSVHAQTPQRIEDNLVFTLESGKVQKVNLNAFAWDALFLRDFSITSDTTLSGSRPIVVFGKITVPEGKTLRIAAGTTLYFDQHAGIDVYGHLAIEGEAQNEVVLRGNRLDHMFDYLPYDGLSGQWQGIRLYPSSAASTISYADIHGTYDAIVVDSADVTFQRLLIANTTIHNCQGYGLLSRHAKISVTNSVISNALNGCVSFEGGEVMMNGCTLAQFYPFDSHRGPALRFGATATRQARFSCSNTIVTGYADDEVVKIPGEGKDGVHFSFESCLLRMKRDETGDSVWFKNVIYENLKDTTQAGYKNFKRVDTDSLRYDFSLRESSLAIGKASYATSLPVDREGRNRDDSPDIGAYEYFKP